MSDEENLRDAFAAMAMLGLLAANWSTHSLAEQAYGIANAMLEERKRHNDK